MTRIVFYKTGLPRCRCGRAAAYEIQGSGNTRYDYACERCANKRVRELQRAYDEINRRAAATESVV